MPAISVIIPVYKVEKYLRRCLDSVLNQTFTDWEAICVNDGSPDNSAAILDEYAARDPRFKVITKENGGLSDARNVGMAHASGEYILYLDSDDFIHPQTMEVTHALAQRDKSDMVSFTYDRLYRPRLIVRHFLGMKTDDIVPWRIGRRYDVSKLDTVVTDNIFDYATEASRVKGENKKWMIKHCQVWKNLYRRDLLAGLDFVKGLLFEDLPWWSAVLLRRPRTTITALPLYYYIPNFGGIALSSKQFRIMECLCIGLSDSFDLYSRDAGEYEMKKWQTEFMWPFISHAFSKIKKLDNDTDLNKAREIFKNLHDKGMLAGPVTKSAHECRDKIMEFINQ